MLGTMWAGDAAALAKRYEGVTAVDVGKQWKQAKGDNHKAMGGDNKMKVA